MIISLLYIFFVIGIPIIFCILLYRLRKIIPYGHIIMPIIIGIIALRTVILSPMYMLVPVISDTSYELFRSCLVLLIQYYYYAIVTMCFYIASYIFMKEDLCLKNVCDLMIYILECKNLMLIIILWDYKKKKLFSY